MIRIIWIYKNPSSFSCLFFFFPFFQGDDPPIQQPHTSVQVDRPSEYAPDYNSLSPPPKYVVNSL